MVLSASRFHQKPSLHSVAVNEARTEPFFPGMDAWPCEQWDDFLLTVVVLFVFFLKAQISWVPAIGWQRTGERRRRCSLYVFSL